MALDGTGAGGSAALALRGPGQVAEKPRTGGRHRHGQLRRADVRLQSLIEQLLDEVGVLVVSAAHRRDVA